MRWLKRRVAAVGDEPAVTKSQQTLDLGKRMVLTDTPGLMWPKIEHRATATCWRRAMPSAPTPSSKAEVAAFLADILLARYPALLAARYGCPVAGLDGVGMVEAIGAGAVACTRQGAPRRDRSRQGGAAPAHRLSAAAPLVASAWRLRRRAGRMLDAAHAGTATWGG